MPNYKKPRWIRTTRGATPHHVCFECRVSFKDITICPHCRHRLIVTRVKFKPPRRNNLRDWKRLHLLYLAGQSWNAVTTPRDAKQLLENKWRDNPIDQWDIKPKYQYQGYSEILYSLKLKTRKKALR